MALSDRMLYSLYITIIFRPVLRTPPPLTAEGKVAEPVPEKSFLQKYWIYLVVAVIALGKSLSPPLLHCTRLPPILHMLTWFCAVMSPAPPEEEGGGNARQGGR